MTNPTQKPLEEGWYWVRYHFGPKWFPAYVADYAQSGLELEPYIQLPGWQSSKPLRSVQDIELGPRILPPQEGDLQ